MAARKDLALLNIQWKKEEMQEYIDKWFPSVLRVFFAAPDASRKSVAV